MTVADSIDFIFYIVIYSVQMKRLAVSEDGGLSGGGLTGNYYISSISKNNSPDHIIIVSICQ